MANPEFTLEQALAVQADQLRHWKKLLKPHVYEMLKEECEKKNKNVTDPYHIFRGTNMDNFIHNLILV